MVMLPQLHSHRHPSSQFLSFMPFQSSYSIICFLQLPSPMISFPQRYCFNDNHSCSILNFHRLCLLLAPHGPLHARLPPSPSFPIPQKLSYVQSISDPCSFLHHLVHVSSTSWASPHHSRHCISSPTFPYVFLFMQIPFLYILFLVLTTSWLLHQHFCLAHTFRGSFLPLELLHYIFLTDKPTSSRAFSVFPIGSQ